MYSAVGKRELELFVRDACTLSSAHRTSQTIPFYLVLFASQIPVCFISRLLLPTIVCFLTRIFFPSLLCGYCKLTLVQANQAWIGDASQTKTAEKGPRFNCRRIGLRGHGVVRTRVAWDIGDRPQLVGSLLDNWRDQARPTRHQSLSLRSAPSVIIGRMLGLRGFRGNGQTKVRSPMVM